MPWSEEKIKKIIFFIQDMEFTLSGEKKKTKGKLFKIWYLHAMIRRVSQKKIKKFYSRYGIYMPWSGEKIKNKNWFFLINGIYMPWSGEKVKQKLSIVTPPVCGNVI